MPDSPHPEDTALLLEAARQGDAAALDRLFARCRLHLRRWAHGRLPPRLRALADTDDLVQDTLVQAFRHLEGFEHRGEGALLAYLRQAVLHRLADLRRYAGRRPEPVALVDDLEADGPSPLDVAIGAEALARYDAALARLSESEREAVIARVELGLSYQAMADTLGKPSPNAARMAVVRALVRLADLMDHDEGASGTR